MAILYGYFAQGIYCIEFICWHFFCQTICENAGTEPNNRFSCTISLVHFSAVESVMLLSLIYIDQIQSDGMEFEGQLISSSYNVNKFGHANYKM